MRTQPRMNSDSGRRDFLRHAAAVGLAAAFPQRLAGLLAADAAPEDSWKTFRNGPELRGVAARPLPEKLELLWEMPTPDGVVGTPAILDGRTFVGTLSGDLLCLDLTSGEEIWKYQALVPPDQNTFVPGFAAPIGIAGDLVFAGDDSGVMHAVDRASGELRWKFESKDQIVGGPTFDDQHVIFGSHDGKLYCLARADGAKAWEYNTEGPVNGTPVLAGPYTFVTGCDKPVLRIVDTQTGAEHSEAPLRELMIASAAIVGDLLYFGTDNGTVYAYDWRKHEPVWTYSVPNRQQQIHSSPAVTEELVVIGSRDRHLHAIDRKTGEGRWTFQTRAKIDGSPVIAGDRVYFGSSDRILYGVSLADGQQVWRHAAGQSVTGSPAIAEGKLVIGTETSSGRVLCFGAR
ncbi:MAG: PQQ-binding-like beta-propeller repeat protein [Planctomyces sp.]|nr:PQQ-binding-like beta-propeller repeat protein [Planctomyces sp.]